MTRGFKSRANDVAGKCLADIARDVIGCHVTQGTRVHGALVDVVGKCGRP